MRYYGLERYYLRMDFAIWFFYVGQEPLERLLPDCWCRVWADGFALR